jgi:hypothetical protein
MPYEIIFSSGKWRIYKKGGGLAKNKSGTPLDGGGHKTKAEAVRQLRALYANETRDSLQAKDSYKGRSRKNLKPK